MGKLPMNVGGNLYDYSARACGIENWNIRKRGLFVI